MTAPDHLTEEAKTLYERVRLALVKQGTWQDHDCDLLERYVTATLDARLYATEGRKEPLVNGSRGNRIPNPLVKLARDLSLDAEKFATSLLLTPKARRQAGIAAPEKGDDLDDLLA